MPSTVTLWVQAVQNLPLPLRLSLQSKGSLPGYCVCPAGSSKTKLLSTHFWKERKWTVPIQTGLCSFIYSQPTLPFFRYLYNHSLNVVEYNCTHNLSRQFKEQNFLSFSFLLYLPSCRVAWIWNLTVQMWSLEVSKLFSVVFSCFLFCPFSFLTCFKESAVDCRLLHSFQLTIANVTVDICVLRIKNT